MASNAPLGLFNGKEVSFTLTESELLVAGVGLETETIQLDTIVAITKGAEDEYILHLFESKAKDEWKAKNLVYKSHVVKALPASLIEQLSVSEFPKALRPSSDPEANLWTCISTLSGTGEGSEFFENAFHPLMAALKLGNYQQLITSSKDSIPEWCSNVIVPRANEGIDQTIILMSGDGGPIDLVNGLMDELDLAKAKVPTLALLPLGTGNALANSSGVAKDKTFGVRNLFKGKPQPIPTFEATFSPGAKVVTDEGQSREPIPSPRGQPILHGVVVCSWGFHASLVADSDTVEYRKFGAERFKMAATELLYPKDGSAPHVYKGKVTVTLNTDQGNSQKEVGGSDHAYTLLTLASNLEQTFTISPASKPLDGQLRLVHFGPISAEDIMRLMGLAYQGGKHVDDPLVDYEAVTGMRIDFAEDEERWRRVCLDGKIVAVEKGGWVDVKPGRSVLNLLAP